MYIYNSLVFPVPTVVVWNKMAPYDGHLLVFVTQCNPFLLRGIGFAQSQ